MAKKNETKEIPIVKETKETSVVKEIPETLVTKEVSKTEKPTKGYVPLVKEENLYHVKIDQPAFNPNTGEKISRPFVQKFTPTRFKNFKKSAPGLGYQFEVLWDPFNQN